jgi:hypothetical protein
MIYTAREGERLDLIAYKLYGDAKRIDLLLRENRITEPFTGAGEVLEVPQEVETETYKPVEVPPWLKNS